MITSETISKNTAQTVPFGSTTDNLISEIHENHVPPFIETALQQLYGNVFSSLAHQRVHGDLNGLHAFVLRNGGSVRTAWLYKRDARCVRVLNEGIEVRDDEVQRFARNLFARHPLLGAIRFHAVRPRLARTSYPHAQHPCLEDMVLALPASADAYRAQMGKSTRSYINRYLNKLKRDFPAMQFSMRRAHEVDESVLRHIIELNRKRMTGKGKVSINDDALAERIIHLAMECGMVGLLTIDGQVVAGTINYQVRDNYFLEIIAHDPAYNEYRLGTLCCYLTVCECIARKGAEYHFLWGMDEYKTRLLAKPRELDDLVVYRSHLHRLLNADLMLGQFAAKLKWKARASVRKIRQREGRGARAMNAVLEMRRRLRRQ